MNAGTKRISTERSHRCTFSVWTNFEYLDAKVVKVSPLKVKKTSPLTLPERNACDNKLKITPSALPLPIRLSFLDQFVGI